VTCPGQVYHTKQNYEGQGQSCKCPHVLQTKIHSFDFKFPAYSPDLHNSMVRKANSVDAGPSFVTDEYSSSPEEVEDDEGGDKFIEISVSEPTRIGEGMSRYFRSAISTHTMTVDSRSLWVRPKVIKKSF
jgi:hypothetical protein